MPTTTAHDTIRAAIYARISDDQRGDEAGIGRQTDDALALARRRGWLVPAEPYTDNDVSAFKGARRDGYIALMRAVEAGEVDAIIVWQTSRLWRNRRERADGIDVLKNAAVSN